MINTARKICKIPFGMDSGCHKKRFKNKYDQFSFFFYLYAVHSLGQALQKGNTVKSEIKAAACIFFLRFLVRLIYEGGL